MSDEIRPALTPEEWEGARGGDARSRLCETANYVQYHVREQAAAEYVEAMALANEAIPDSHPHKITRADVALLELASRRLDMGSEFGFDPDVADLRLLAAKLAALLPPEGT